MNKIVELVINLEEFEFEDLGVEILSLVDKPAIEVEWMAFSEEQFVKPTPGESQSDFISRCIPIVIEEGKDADQAAAICYTYYRGQQEFSEEEAIVDNTAFESALLKLAADIGDEIDPSEIVYVDGTKENFATITEILEGIKALDLLERIPADLREQEGEIVYRYTGPRGQRGFCRTMVGLNRVYSRADITRMNSLNPGFGAGGSGSYSVFKYKGGPNCQHYWEKLMRYNNGNRDVLISLGTAEGDAGETNNDNYGSPTGSVTNNGYLMSQNWSFSADDKMIITGPAMIPRSLIARKDELGNLFHVYFSEETIEKIARKFLADNNAHNTDINHNGEVVTENTLLESWIVDNPEMDKSKSLGFNVPKGTWMTSMKINNKETWNKIKAGELNGFSVEGSFLEIVQKS